jgi:hypothetical protein
MRVDAIPDLSRFKEMQVSYYIKKFPDYFSFSFLD